MRGWLSPYIRSRVLGEFQGMTEDIAKRSIGCLPDGTTERHKFDSAAAPAVLKM